MAGDTDSLQTEQRNPRTTDIDIVSTEELCRLINDEDAQVAGIVQKCIPTISAAINALVERVRRGGRVFYVGAGTSGRLGVLDASEIPPTYSAPPEQFVGLIAGGDVSLRKAQEGAEDSSQAAVDDLESRHIDGERDALIGLAASGRTPYVLACLELAKAKGCATIGVACVSPSAMRQSGHVDFMIETVTGPEVVTGSTRMKAGTATKLVLNMLSTGTMIRIGKTFGNIMIDVKPTNVKLEQRARRIVREICGERCSLSDDELDDIITKAGRSVKVAAVAVYFQSSVEDAAERIRNANGVLSRVLKPDITSSPSPGQGNSKIESSTPPYVLCVDAGGSKCAAVLRDDNGNEFRGYAGPCNLTEVGVNAALTQIKLAISNAAKADSRSQAVDVSRLNIRKAWIGAAGIDRGNFANLLRSALTNILPSCSDVDLEVTNDIELLARVVGDATPSSAILVLLAGTGAVAMNYVRQSGRLIRESRAGGWGALLGDEGSGFDIGRQALRTVLKTMEQRSLSGESDSPSASADPLTNLVITHFGVIKDSASAQDLLNSVVLNAKNEPQDAAETKRKIASCARVVIEASTSSKQAQAIVQRAKLDLIEMVTPYLHQDISRRENTHIVLAGGLMQSEAFRTGLQDMLHSAFPGVGGVTAVADPASAGASLLAKAHVV